MPRLTEQELRRGYEADGLSEAGQERALDVYEAANPDDEQPKPATVAHMPLPPEKCLDGEANTYGYEAEDMIAYANAACAPLAQAIRDLLACPVLAGLDHDDTTIEAIQDAQAALFQATGSRT